VTTMLLDPDLLGPEPAHPAVCCRDCPADETCPNLAACNAYEAWVMDGFYAHERRRSVSGVTPHGNPYFAQLDPDAPVCLHMAVPGHDAHARKVHRRDNEARRHMTDAEAAAEDARRADFRATFGRATDLYSLVGDEPARG
jgi:hypothetical protein